MSQSGASSAADFRTQSPRVRLRHPSPTTPRRPPLEMHTLSFCSLWDGSPTTGMHHPSNIATAPLKKLPSEHGRRHRHLAEWPVGCPWKDHGAHRLAACGGPGSLDLLIWRIAHVKHILTNKNKQRHARILDCNRDGFCKAAISLQRCSCCDNQLQEVLTWISTGHAYPMKSLRQVWMTLTLAC